MNFAVIVGGGQIGLPMTKVLADAHHDVVTTQDPEFLVVSVRRSFNCAAGQRLLNGIATSES
ncbi:MAG: hypothetical protein EBW15_05515 [Actinobacteria bacterium]|nr:hypothetical protein [Actinomycetota bacterium]